MQVLPYIAAFLIAMWTINAATHAVMDIESFPAKFITAR